jgi:hypothetical protein
MMSARVAAWSLAVLGISLTATFHVLDLVNDHRWAPPVVGTLVGVAFLVVGALIASNKPRNPIGWIYLVGLTLVAFGGSENVSEQYAHYAVTRPGALPGVEWVIWAGQLSLTLGFTTLVFFSLLLFPDGRLPSPRWRPVAVAAVIAIGLMTAGVAVASKSELSSGVVFASPLGIVWADPLIDVLGFPTFIFLIGVALACVASVLIRFRAASGVERQQLKWFAYGAGLIPAVGVGATLLSFVAPTASADIGPNLWPLSVAGIPIASAIAILKFHLYDIDVLVNRTLVYGALSAVLAATYFVAIISSQAVLRSFTGGSEIAVALSTLAVVAVFAPVRSRIRRFVDRRFYRSRYDAARTLDDFSVRLRDEVDLDAVRAGLIDAVQHTVQPAHASVWLRGGR